MEFPVTNLYELDSRVFQVQKKSKQIYSNANQLSSSINYWSCNFAGQLEHPVQARGEPWQVLGGCNQVGG